MTNLLVSLLAVFASATYQLCGHDHCTRPHAAYQVECGGSTWLSPRRVWIPPARRRDSRWQYWCVDAIPAF